MGCRLPEEAGTHQGKGEWKQHCPQPQDPGNSLQGFPSALHKPDLCSQDSPLILLYSGARPR